VRRWNENGLGGAHGLNSDVGWWCRGLCRFDQARRRQRGRRRSRRLLRFARLATTNGRWRVRKGRARRHTDIPLARKALDKLTRYDLFDRTRRALHFDAMVTLEQRDDFLARRAEQFCNLVDPNGRHLPLFFFFCSRLFTVRLG
jgi:hypothetical protein